MGALHPAFYFAKSSTQQSLERKKANLPRRCIRAVDCKHFHKSPHVLRHSLSLCAATQGTPSTLPVPLALRPEHESDSWSRFFGKTIAPEPSHSTRGPRTESARNRNQTSSAC